MFRFRCQIFQRKLKTANLFYRTSNKKRTVFRKNPRVGKNTNNDTFCICIDAARNEQPLTTKQQHHHQPPPPPAAVVVVVLGSCSAAYVVLVLPLFCELSTIQVRKVLLIYDDRHAFSSIPESLCLKKISLYLYHRASDYYTSSYILRIQIHR